MDEHELVEELVRRSGPEVDRALELLGLYVDGKEVVGREGLFGPEYALAISGTIGDIAFSRRIQDPEGESVDAIFETIIETTDQSESDNAHSVYERLRRNLEGDQG